MAAVGASGEAVPRWRRMPAEQPLLRSATCCPGTRAELLRIPASRIAPSIAPRGPAHRSCGAAACFREAALKPRGNHPLYSRKHRERTAAPSQLLPATCHPGGARWGMGAARWVRGAPIGAPGGHRRHPPSHRARSTEPPAVPGGARRRRSPAEGTPRARARARPRPRGAPRPPPPPVGAHPPPPRGASPELLRLAAGPGGARLTCLPPASAEREAPGRLRRFLRREAGAVPG